MGLFDSGKRDEGHIFDLLYGSPAAAPGNLNYLARLLADSVPPPRVSSLGSMLGATRSTDPFGFSVGPASVGSCSSGEVSNLTTLASLFGEASRKYGAPPLPAVPIPSRLSMPPARPKKASLRDDLLQEVSKIFRSRWTTRDGNVVPASNSIALDNDAVKLDDATVLYADLADSTNLVDAYGPEFPAEIYKTFLHCAGKIIRSEGGEITAYDGDRIMAVYLRPSKHTSAVRSALKINYAVQRIICTLEQTQYPKTPYQVRHKIGIDTSSLFVAKTGFRGANDLVWIGRAANYAAKLSMLDDTYRTYITPEVYNVLEPSVKDKKSVEGKPMWEPRLWTSFDSRLIYASNWWYEVS